MAQISKGFNGSITASDWAMNAALLLTTSPITGSLGDCVATQVAGIRAVSVAAGSVGADGIATRLTTPEQVDLPVPSNGQWYLLVLNRVWGTASTSLRLRNGPTTGATGSGAAPSAYPATFQSAAGVNADVALCWLWANSTSTAVRIVPIIRPSMAKVPRRGTTAERDAYFGDLSTFPQQFAIQGAEWVNTELAGARERFVASYDAIANPLGIDAAHAGWYGPEGQQITVTSGGSGVNVPDGTSTVIGLGVVERRKGFAIPTSSGLVVTRSGRYQAEISGLYDGSTSTGFRRLGLIVNGSTYANPAVSAEANGERSTDTSTNLYGAREITLTRGDVLQIVAAQKTGASQTFIRNHPRTFMTLRYVGQP
jgi:hypothetical protein